MGQELDHSTVLNRLLDTLPPEFSLAQAEALLPDSALAGRLQRELDTDGRFFDDGNGNYVARAAFFQGGEFLLTPDDYEIDQGILIPGHRFSAFFPESVFPSEVTLLGPEGEPFPVREFRAPLLTVFPYCLLLGSEQIFDYLVAEHADNARLRNSARGREEVVLRVFDLSAFYERFRFSSGDALTAVIVDYERGVARCEFRSGEQRRQRQLEEYCSSYADALERVIDRFDNYLEIPEQLAWGFYGGGRRLLQNPGASLDEFIRLTSRIEIGFEGEHSTLIRRREEPEAEEFAAAPEGVGISRGETGSLAEILKELGVVLTPTELDGFILDSLYRREDGFEAFFRRCFGDGPLPFVDEAQEAVFLNYLEDRYESLAAVYDRVADEPVSELRGSIVELLEEKNAFLRQVAGELPPEPLRRLASISLGLNELLDRINQPGGEFPAAELEAAAERVAEAAARQEETLAALELEADRADAEAAFHKSEE